MRIFPGIDTPEERRKFAIFHACTLVASPVAGALYFYFVNHQWPFDHDKPLWAAASLILWNIFGSWRFMTDAYDEGFWAGRLASVMLLICFPFVYLHNVWRVLHEKE